MGNEEIQPDFPKNKKHKKGKTYEDLALPGGNVH